MLENLSYKLVLVHHVGICDEYYCAMVEGEVKVMLLQCGNNGL